METQTPTILIAFAAVMLTLAGTILTTLRGMRSEMRARLDAIDSHLDSVEHGRAHLAGVREGILEALSIRGSA